MSSPTYASLSKMHGMKCNQTHPRMPTDLISLQRAHLLVFMHSGLEKNISATCSKHRPCRRDSWGTQYVQLANRSLLGSKFICFLTASHEQILEIVRSVNLLMQTTCKATHPLVQTGVSTGLQRIQAATSHASGSKLICSICCLKSLSASPGIPAPKTAWQHAHIYFFLVDTTKTS